MIAVGLTVIAVALIIPFTWREIQRRRSLAILSRFYNRREDLIQAVSEFEAHLGGERWVSNYDYSNWKKKAEPFMELSRLDFSSLGEGDFVSIARKFTVFVYQGRSLIDEKNKQITAAETEVLKPILQKRTIPFNAEQLQAAVSEEDNTLVVAGAGTGKTTTILSKLAYLTDRLDVNPADILVLSFTKKVVDELAERIASKLPNKNFDVRTFHSFGLSVLANVLQTKPSIFDPEARRPWLQSEFDKLLAADSEYLRAAVHYFAFHLQYQDEHERFSSMDEYYRYIRTESVITFQKEKVKSIQEAMIANFLFLNGINYQYEAPYKYQTADQLHRQYAPDFYLPDYDIYIEHFGIDRKGDVHFTDNETQNTIAGIKYREGMEWKRNVHRSKHTTLVETFSYQFSEHTWQDQLRNQLDRCGVKPSPRAMGEVIESLQESGQIMQIVSLFATFLDLTKSNHYSEEKIKSMVDERNRPREIAFSKLFLPLYRRYEEYLALSQKIDFHDMLNQASVFIEQKRFLGTYKYIIIDEFQDFSVSKDLMVRALCTQNAAVKIFCVGDDWQSIYRFAGADVNLMTHFPKYHGYTNNLRLERTNRFDKKLATVTNQFILKNPSQIRKEIQARHELPHQPISIVKTISPNDLATQVGNILDELSREATEKNQSVYLLGRYGFNKPVELVQWRKQYPNLSIEFITAHSSKGLEADNVIVLDVVAGKYGFPSQVADDPVLSLVLSDAEGYPHAEERRLMYVALTRTRNKVYVTTRQGFESVFIPELEKLLGEPLTKADRTCPHCSGKIVERTSKYGPFLACSNYPNCTWKQDFGDKAKGKHAKYTNYR